MPALRKPTADRRREIAEAAIQLIGERGLREFTAARLAAEVGITDGSIFRHFKDMNEVIEAALDRIEELISAVPEGGGPLERLELFVMARLRAIEAQPGIPSLVFSDQLAHALGAKGPKRVAALRNRARAFVRSCLREAAAQGLIRDDLDLDAATLLVTGMVMSFLFASKDGALHGSAENMRQRAWQTLLAMLRPRQVKR